VAPEPGFDYPKGGGRLLSVIGPSATRPRFVRRTGGQVPTSRKRHGVHIYVDGRRVSTNNEYDARIRLTAAGGVAVGLTKYA